MHARYWLARWRDARNATARVMPFVSRGVVYPYLCASLIVLGAIAATGGLTWVVVAGVVGPTILLSLAALGHDVYQLFKIIPERDHELWQKVEEVERLPKPYVQFAGCRKKRGLLHPGAPERGDRPGKSSLGGHVEFLDICQVGVRNAPPGNSSGDTAKRAAVTLEYFLPEGRQPLLVVDHGRWASSFSSGMDAESLECAYRDLYANGETHWIDVTLKSRGEMEWYAVDGAACRGHSTCKDPGLSIFHPEMRVRVILHAEGMDGAISEEYWLYNQGMNTIDIFAARRALDEVAELVAVAADTAEQDAAFSSGQAREDLTAQRPEPSQSVESQPRAERAVMRGDFFSDLARVSRKTPRSPSPSSGEE